MKDSGVILVINCDLTSGVDADMFWDYLTLLVTFNTFNLKAVWLVALHDK
jgi:hypothetical protein